VKRGFEDVSEKAGTFVDRRVQCVDKAAADPAAASGSGAAEAPSAAGDLAAGGALSEHYVSTEGTLLAEFGDFLGKLCDGIEARMQKHD